MRKTTLIGLLLLTACQGRQRTAVVGSDTDTDSTSTSDTTPTVAEISVDPLSVDFGVVDSKDLRSATITLSSTGTDTLQLEQLSLSDSPAFSLTVPADLDALAPGATAELIIDYQPVEPTDSAQLTILSSATTQPEVEVSLTGMLGVLALELTPDPLELSISAPGQAALGDLTLDNTGTLALTVDILAISGDGFWIEEAPPTPFTLEPATQEQLSIGFTASQQGDFSGEFGVLGDNLPGGIQTVGLVGSSTFSNKAGCPHPSVEVIDAVDPSGVTDIVFDADCSAWVSTTVSGTDYVYIIQGGGGTTVITGYSNYNIQSLALDPLTGDLAVSHNNNSSAGIGYSSGGAKITQIAPAEYNNSTLWTNEYMNRSSGSLVWDSNGCIWAPGFAGSGSLSCVRLDGSSTTLISHGPHIESVALDAGENLYASMGNTVNIIDLDSGATIEYFVAAGDILDMVFDDLGDLYVESTAGQIERVPADGAAPSLFAEVSGQGRLAFAPDGWLVRVIPNPLEAASYEEWSLK